MKKVLIAVAGLAFVLNCSAQPRFYDVTGGSGPYDIASMSSKTAGIMASNNGVVGCGGPLFIVPGLWSSPAPALLIAGTNGLPVDTVFTTGGMAVGGSDFPGVTNPVSEGCLTLYSNLNVGGVMSGNAGGVTNITITGPTNATPPGNTSTIKAWANFTNSLGGVFKLPLYQ